MSINTRRLMVGMVACGALACAAFASAADAVQPEVGRCVAVERVTVEGKKNPQYTGGYTNKNCTHASPKHRGHYEWYAGPGAHPHFYGVADEPEPLLETKGGAKIVCSIATAEGEYTGPKTEKITKLLFQGCTENDKTCQDVPVKEGEIEVTELTGELGVVKGPPKELAGWDLKKSGTWATYTCGTTEGTTLQELEGSVIGVVTKGEGFGDLNTMSKESFVQFKQSHGKQEPESFEAQPADVLMTTTIKIPGGEAKEQTGLETLLETRSGLGKPSEEAVNEEPYEIRTKPEEAAA